MSYNDYMKNLLDMQQEGMKFWQNQMQELGKMASAGAPYQMPTGMMSNPFAAMPNPFLNNQDLENAYQNQLEKNKKVIDSSQEVMQTWADFANKFMQDQMSAMQNPMENLDLHSKMVAGREAYETMAEQFANLYTQMGEAAGQPFADMEKMRKQYSGLFAESLLNTFPAPFKNMVSSQLQMYKSGSDIKDNLVQPWIEQAQNMQRLLFLAGTGNADAASDFLKQWQTMFSQTFGRFLNMPVFSMNQADMQDMMDVLDSYISFMNSFGRFMVAILEQGEETFMDVMKDFQDMVKNNEMPTTFKGFYDYWIQANEKAYKKLFGTESFGKLMNHVVDNFIRLKKEYDQVLNNFIKLLPLPSTEDMDSVYKKIDTLKRDVRELKSQSMDLSAYDKKMADLEKEHADMKKLIKDLEKANDDLKKDLAAAKKAANKK